MNWELIKHKFCRLAVTASLLLGGVMVSAAASGTMPLWAALLGLFAAVVMLNAACGILLGTPAAEPRRAVPARTSRPAVQLCVVRPICCEPYNCGKPRAALAARGLPYPKAYVTMGKKQKDVT